MKTRTLFLFVLAVGFGLVATVMAKTWINNNLAKVSDDAQLIVVAAQEIPFGQKIGVEHLTTRQSTTVELPDGVYRDINEVAGKVANRKFLRNEPLLADWISDNLNGSVLASVVSPNMRAVSLRANDVIGVAGFLLPGNRVDVIATRKGYERRTHTETILEDVKVLAVDQTASSEHDGPVVVRAVTLELNPEQAERLVQATEEGSVQLVLRNPDDGSRIVKKPEVKPKPVAVDIKPEPKKIVNKVAKKQVDTVVVIRGAASETTNLKL